MTYLRIIDLAPRLVDPSIDIATIDYVRSLSTRLHSDKTYANGMLMRVDFYEQANPFANLVVREDYVYTRDVTTDLLTGVDQVISWYNVDGTVGIQKTFGPRYYDIIETLQVDKDRRSRAIEIVKMATLFMIANTESVDIATATTMGAALMLAHSTATQAWIETSGPVLTDAIAADTTFGWLDNDLGDGTTIRQAIIAGII